MIEKEVHDRELALALTNLKDSAEFKDRAEKRSNFREIFEPYEQFLYDIYPEQYESPRYHLKTKRIPLTQGERESIFEIKGRQCFTCGKLEDLQIHHIDGNPRNNAEENLEVNCYTCHKKIHKKQSKTYQRRFKNDKES